MHQQGLFQELEEFSVDELKQLLAVMLLTDGYATKINGYAKISFCNLDKALHELFVYLMRKSYSKDPTTFMYRGMDTEFRRACNPVLEDLMKLTESFHARGNSRANFLLTARENVKIWALRIAMSADGSFFINQRGGIIKGSLLLSCMNPNLCDDWKQLFTSFGINMKIKRDAELDFGIHGVQTTKQSNILKYLRIGFIPGVFVHKGYHFKGLEKNVVLSTYCNFIRPVPKGYSRWPKEKFWEELHLRLNSSQHNKLYKGITSSSA